ncbi:hypothetical protein [uncultured Algibacter sp.]|uniref:tetratricopeptide repeat protein n=1 Tax=uncultured Algibacter sp. TaxID=298659 RepID=UPI002603BBA1|nr:hypothetical protein [uncultured Algibacter sp.]
MKTRITTFLITFFFTLSIFADSIIVERSNGNSESINYNYKTILNKGLKNNLGDLIHFEDINTISTSDFDAYEKILSKTQRRGSHIKVEFTGDMSKYAKRLEKLKRNRDGADVARGVGGLMSIIGVLSGDRQLTAAGIAVNGAGQIARDINNDRTMDTQTAMLKELDQRTKVAKDSNTFEEESLRKEYGNENVDGVKELIKNNHKKALAYANLAELSDNSDYQLTAVWLKAMIAKDQNSKEEESKIYQRLVDKDPEIKNTNEAEKETNILVEELSKWRN